MIDLMKLFAARQIQKGFTLIELLVVIGILGILAAALVATIDPFEQLNKASDANAKNTAVEFLNANIRYYTTHSAFPWDALAAGGANCGGVVDPNALTLNSTEMSACLTVLVTEGELKSSFTTATGLISKIYANESAGNILMCYLPLSKSQKKDPNTKYTTTSGGTGGTCPGGSGNTGTCYWCTQ